MVYNPQEGLPETNMGSQTLPSGHLELNEFLDPSPELMYDYNNQPSEMTSENEEGADTEVGIKPSTVMPGSTKLVISTLLEWCRGDGICNIAENRLGHVNIIYLTKPTHRYK